MSLWRGEPRPAPGTIASIAILGGVSVASLSRVIAGTSYVLWALAAAGVGAAVAISVGRRSLGTAIVALVAGWLATLPALFAPQHTAALLPTARAMQDVRALLTSGFDSIATATPPVAPLPRYTIMVWSAFLFLGFLSASWIIVRRPIGAVIAAIGVVVFSGGIGVGAGRDAYALAAVAAAGSAFLFEGRQRIERWGRTAVPVWFGIPTLAVVAVAALGVPAVVGDTAVVNLSGTLRPRLVVIKPLSDVRRQLDVDPPLEVMRVQSNRPAYWRLTGLDTYTGTEWILDARPRSIIAGVVPPPAVPATGDEVDQTYTLTNLLSPWMPAAYAASHISSEHDVDIDAGSQTLLVRAKTDPGLTYSVRSRLLRVTENVAVPPHRVSDDRERIFGDLAKPIVGDVKTPLDAARRLERHFRTFTYDEKVERGHTVERLQRFLTERRGYCEQFAAAMTLMMRGLGYDARVGVGFLPGRLAGGVYVVSTRDAHAWVEVNLPQVGWVSFDPTPARGTPARVEPTVTERPFVLPQASKAPAPTPEALEPTEDIPLVEARGFPFRRVVPFALGVLVLGSVPTTKQLRRMRRRNAPPREAIVGAFAELADRCAELGRPLRANETHREFVRRVLGDEADGADTAAQLVEICGRAVYGVEDVTASDATAAWLAVGPALGTVRGGAPRWRRALAVFDPRVLLPTLTLRRLRPRVPRRRAVARPA